MDTITITLNGREVSGHPGMTILELAQESGVDIPTLCHDPLLTPIGACRICIVEDERRGVLLASCVSPIMSGMVINTESPRVLERRKTIVELMLASHPDSCLVCDKGNRCKLRKIAADMGIGLVQFQKIPQAATIGELNPFIERDMSKCILCAKCIRADQELVVEGALDYIDRGFASRPATLLDVPLEKSECTFCGTCVDVCPTGALMERDNSYRATARKSVDTICPFCGCGCAISLEIRGNRVVRSRPGRNGSVNKGTLCSRGSYGYDFIHSPERLSHPLLKTNDTFEEVSWEAALDAIADGLRRVKEASDSNALAVLGSSKGTNEENYLLQWFARGVLGTNNIDNGSRLYNSASLIGLGSSIGFPGSTSRLEDIEGSEVILVIGADPTASAPIVGYALKRAVKNRGSKLLLVDPRQTKLLPFADLWLNPTVGTDVALLNGMAKVIVDEGLLDEEHVGRRTDNFDALTEGLQQYSAERVEEITGIPSEDLRYAARLFAGATQASIVYGNGITQHSSGSDAVLALANLAMLTGNISRRRGGIYALQRDSNAQGACDMGCLPDFLPGYQSMTDMQARKRFEEHWRVQLPTDQGLTAVEMLQQAREGHVRAMFVVGEDPAGSFPDSTSIKQALDNLDFLAVQDMFMTRTAEMANVVLPAASFAEKEGTVTNFEGRAQRVRKALDPIGESLGDSEVLLRLAKRMGSPKQYLSLQEIMDEIEDTVPLYLRYSYTGGDPGEVEQSEFDVGTVGVRRLYKGRFPDGFGRFSSVQYVPTSQVSHDGYPFTLLVGTILHQFGNDSRAARSSRLQKFCSDSFVEICASDAQQLGISHGDAVKLVSPTAEVSTVARIGSTVSHGLLFMPMSLSSSHAADLFDISLDPQSKTPSFKSCAVRIERIGSHG